MRQSDACTLPLGRVGQVLLQGARAKFACYRHDFAYYKRDILYDRSNPERKVDWVAAKLSADMELKINRRLVAKCWFLGIIYSRLYFRAVRVGASKKAKSIDELPIPPTLQDLLKLQVLMGASTRQSENIFAKWRFELDGVAQLNER